MSHQMPTALTIAGSDTIGGAGIQADLKTMTVHSVYGMSAITALTAQNTLGVQEIYEVPAEFLREELDAILSDIRPDAVKIGMITSVAQIRVIAEKLKEYHLENIVVDPVIASTSGATFLKEEALSALSSEIFPMADLITPNIPEAEALSHRTITDTNGMEDAAGIIQKMCHTSILLKGGHLEENPVDFLLTDHSETWLAGEHIANENTHGTGCTLSSAIASNLALGFAMEDSVARAKAYLTGAIADGLNLGRGNGPLNHTYSIINNL